MNENSEPTTLKLSFNGEQISRNLIWTNPAELSSEARNAGAIELPHSKSFAVELTMVLTNEPSVVSLSVSEAKLFTVLSESAGDSQALSPFKKPGDESPWTALQFPASVKAANGECVLVSTPIEVREPASRNVRWELNLVLVAHIQIGSQSFSKLLRFDPEVVVTQR